MSAFLAGLGYTLMALIVIGSVAAAVSKLTTELIWWWNDRQRALARRQAGYDEQIVRTVPLATRLERTGEGRAEGGS
ncbi:hypothetical protein [Actinoplanes rectilineatus]|uniref:hypothetical protein n=1 Tax=Actinoplanes rectilineatus TaxID=113571 RepID=UPI0005F2DE97|nr:hypothetical protein [Actinoplanes rectilineatus]